MAWRAFPSRSRVRYAFDNLMAHGTPVLIGWLALVCLAIVVPASVVLVLADRDAPPTFSGRMAAVWESVGRTLKIGGEVGPPLYVVMSILLGLVALLFVSALVSLITAGLNERLMALRLGRSVVLEERHTVLLGWSDQVFPVLTELVAANANQRGAAVAVLADKDKVEMDVEIAGRVGETGRTRVICRSGPTTDPAILTRINPGPAKAVLVLPSGGPGGDAHVVKTLLALDAAGPPSGDRVVVAAVRNPRHHLAATLAAGRDGHVLSIDDIVARLLVQTSRQPGLSLVYRELLDFAGDEFYVVPAAALTGRTFGEALGAFATSSVVGLVRADGSTVLNPPSTARVEEGDRLIVITEDDDTATPADTVPPVDEEAIVTALPRTQAPERMLLLGWNRRAPLIIEQLDQYVRAGSRLDVVALGDATTAHEVRAATTDPDHLLVSFHNGDITEQRTLAGLDVPSYDSVMLIGDESAPSEGGTATDDRTLVTLLHLRAVEESARRELAVITELTDDRNRLLAPVRQGADFIVSGRLISLLMTQIAENRHLADVFQELFTAEGSEIHLKPAIDYVPADREVTFATVVESARRRHECAIGYRLRAEASIAPTHGVRVNPDKRTKVRFGAGDCVIVVAEG
ncbi:CASTOR/POLLUX-related putative ion channel [Streptomyces lavendofoliae]|uniref:CASTOR/POLLUX-related putative ion channel n=1 Tax=Streptomyces lavendofoliae TaxID=67314 RepID=UPI00300EAC11